MSSSAPAHGHSHSHSSRMLESAVAVTGVHARTPQAVVHSAAAGLRQLLDERVPSSDPRCQALLQLANLARLCLLPQSNDGAAHAHDLSSRAMHVDVSAATLVAAMGVPNVSALPTVAMTIASSASPDAIRPHPPRPAAAPRPPLVFTLTPRLCAAAVHSTFALLAADPALGLRAVTHPSAFTARPRVRMSNRPSTARRRRPSAPNPPANPYQLPPPAPPLPPIVPSSDLLPSAQPLQPPPLPPPPPPPPLLQQHHQQLQHPGLAWHNFRPRPTLIQKRHRVAARASLSKDKGVMNDTVGTPDDVMDAFIHSSKSPHPIHDNLDDQARIRAVLAERERVLYRLIRRRRAELSAIPIAVTEQTRRKAIIQAKQLALLPLQRVVRYRVCAELKKSLSTSVQENRHVPPDNMSRLFRRRDPPIYSYMDGYPRITPIDAIPEMPPRHPTTVTQDSLRMAEFDLTRMAAQKKRRNHDYLEKLRTHFDTFTKSFSEARNNHSRTFRNLERYFIEKKRLEERRRKMERIERLKLLRSNDEQAYLNLLKNTKNERLLQLVRQTDNYLMQIGAQVEQQRDATERVPGGDAHNAFADELGGTGDVPIEAMRRRRDLYYTVTHAVQEEVKQPSIMVHGTLKAYQIEGLKWMVSLYNNNLNGILADEMGLGKTIQTISLITYLVEVKKNPGPYMVIVPLSTMGNWVRELNLWAPSLEKIEYFGDRHKRRQLQRKELTAGTFNVLLTTYEYTVKDQHVLSPVKWQYIIIDEGHRMKNANCKLAMTLGIKYKSRNRLLLTGTPLQNSLTELWALLNFLLPNIFSSSDTFETWFKQPFETTTLGDTADLEEEERLLVINRLHQVLRPFLLRRLKTDVETQLPQKVEHVIRCDMSAWQWALYRQITNRIGLATGANNGSFKAYNNLLMQCKKVCNHPYLFYDAESVEHLPPDFLIRASGKFFVLHHMLPKLRLHGHRTLIFSQMTAALDYLEVFLSTIGIRYLRLDGNTRSEERQELLNQFNDENSPYFAFLLSTRAGGLGLNLQTADTVIIFDSDWNPMMDLQAQDRAHRIGQKRVVRVYRLICSGTVEVKILEQANKKLQVDAQVIQAGQFNNKSTESDRHQMLKGILRQKTDDESGVSDVPAMEELNTLIARSDEEIEEYAKFDKETNDNGSFKPLFTDESELPEWVLKPDVEHKDAAEKEAELLNSHGRGRRKRKLTMDMDKLTEAEWFKVAEGEMTIEEAFEKREKRKLARKSGGAAQGQKQLERGDEGYGDGEKDKNGVNGKEKTDSRDGENGVILIGDDDDAQGDSHTESAVTPGSMNGVRAEGHDDMETKSAGGTKIRKLKIKKWPAGKVAKEDGGGKRSKVGVVEKKEGGGDKKVVNGFGNEDTRERRKMNVELRLRLKRTPEKRARARDGVVGKERANGFGSEGNTEGSRLGKGKGTKLRLRVVEPGRRSLTAEREGAGVGLGGNGTNLKIRIAVGEVRNGLVGKKKADVREEPVMNGVPSEGQGLKRKVVDVEEDGIGVRRSGRKRRKRTRGSEEDEASGGGRQAPGEERPPVVCRLRLR